MPARRHGADQLEVAADRCDELAEVAEVAELMGDDVDTDGDATGLPEIAVAPLGGPYAVYELRRCGPSSALLTAASRAGLRRAVPFELRPQRPELQLRGPYRWYVAVGTPPTGVPNYCTASPYHDCCRIVPPTPPTPTRSRMERGSSENSPHLGEPAPAEE